MSAKLNGATAGGRARAVFLDRDGVINRAINRGGKPYSPQSLAEFDILPGVVEACVKLKAANFLLIVATNQPDVGRGQLPQSTVETLHEMMCRCLPIDRVEVCYDSGKETEPCVFRKPQPGMLMRAAQQLRIDLHQSWMVGDRWRDIDCGVAAGCRTILIDYGYAESLHHPPDFKATALLDAAHLILAHQ
jgi:D-glycero-D-manno-heptose 1,7-bisphosphate phosphatase